MGVRGGHGWRRSPWVAIGPGVRACAAVARARVERLAAAEDRRRGAAATMVQAHHRGHMERKKDRLRAQAAVDEKAADAADTSDAPTAVEGDPPTSASTSATAGSAAVVDRSHAADGSTPIAEGLPPQRVEAAEAAAVAVATDTIGNIAAAALTEELLDQRKRAIASALVAEGTGDRRRALLAYFSVVKLSLRLLTETEDQLSERTQLALSLGAKAMTARAIRLQRPDATLSQPVAETEGSNAVALMASKAMQADAAGEDVVASLELYRTSISMALELEDH